MAIEDKSINQSRLGTDGRGGTTKPGDIFKRKNFRVYFVGGLAAIGLAWFLTSVKPDSKVSSKLTDISRGGSKPPTNPDKDTKVQHAEGPTYKTGQKVASPHGGVAAGQSEGAKPRL